MPISLEAKHILVDTANCLRNQDESAARAHFSRLEPQAQHAVYHRLWEMMGRPQTHSDFGRAAFWNQDAQTAPLSQKLRAVEAGLVTPPNEERPPRQALALPSGASKVRCNAFSDCGFDPRFDFSGDYMNPPSESLTFWETLVGWITYLEFTLRSYFSFDPEERTFRQMLLASAKAELTWAKQTESTFIDSYDSATHVWIREYDFLERASEFYKQLHPEHEGRLYPHELLIPIHYINHPQASYWRKDCAEPNWENGDLSRSGSWGYWRLRGDMYGYDPLSSNPPAIDLIDYRYVPHYLFIRAMTAPSDALKTALREYRSTISSITTDAKCARSFETCKQQLLPKIEAFHAAWRNYTQSHELLQETQSLFSKIDPYQAERDHSRAKIPSFFNKFVESIREIFHDADKERRQLHDEGYESLKQTLLRDFPLSHSARLLNAYAERWPQRG